MDRAIFVFLQYKNQESCSAFPDDGQRKIWGTAKDDMSNWFLHNDHEVSVVTLMMGLYRTWGRRREHCNFHGIDSQRECHFSNCVNYKMIVISCSMDQDISYLTDQMKWWRDLSGTTKIWSKTLSDYNYIIALGKVKIQQ